MRRWRIIRVGCIAYVIVSHYAEGQTARTQHAAREDSAIIPALHARIIDKHAQPKIDGDLSDEAWGEAERTTPFIQVSPFPSSRPSQATEARVLISHDALYIAIRMYDTAPDSIAAQLGRRDAADLYSDWARVLIDGDRSGRSAVEFAINPGGVKADTYWYGDTREDPAWDAVWDGAARIDSLGWTAEFRIPLSQLRSADHDGDGGATTWGIQFIRDIARYSERDAWSPIPANATGFVSRFGILQNAAIVDTRSHLEIAPYAVTTLASAPGDPSDPFYKSRDIRHSLGADMKYTPRSDVLVNATLNPDFGQVEADPAVVNLTAYQVFFPEQRPFFVEDADLFQEGVATTDVFYSRRIGRIPEVSIPSGAVYSDIPSSSRIIAAGKASRRVGDGWSFGVLDAVTQQEDARYADSSGLLHKVRVEPRTNYVVGRATRSFRGGHSAFGVIATGVNRMLNDSASDVSLASAAYAAGIDIRHQFDDNTYEAAASVVGTYVTGSQQAIGALQRSTTHLFQRPDVVGFTYDSTRVELSGWAAETQLHKIAGHWRGGFDLSALSPGFDVNDAGFEDAADVQHAGTYVGYYEQRPGEYVRNWSAFVNQNWYRNSAGEQLAHTGQLGGQFELRNNWNGSVTLNRDEYGLSVSATRGGPAVVTPPKTGLYLSLNGDDRRRLAWSASASATAEAETRGTTISFAPKLTARLTDRLSMSLQPTVSRVIDPWQYVTTAWVNSGSIIKDPIDQSPLNQSDRRYLFAQVDQHSFAVTARSTFIATPQLSLELYSRPFLSTGHYSEFRQLDHPRARSFAARLRPYGLGDSFTLPNPDFDVVAFQSNAVLRWEYRPGSAIFVVWSQGRDESGVDGLLSVGGATQRLLRTRPTNILLLKLSYWLGL
jgi:hypothetical protein